MWEKLKLGIVSVVIAVETHGERGQGRLGDRMFVSGHLGLGKQVAERIFGAKIPVAAIPGFFLGSIFPDALDKLLYYGFARGAVGEISWISGTRTLGHSLVLMLGLLLLAKLFSIEYTRKWFYWFFLACVIHIFLDHFGEFFTSRIITGEVYPLQNTTEWRRIQGLFWPLLGFRFPVLPYDNLHEHLVFSWAKPHVLIGEIFGFSFLLLDRKRIIKGFSQAFEGRRTRRPD